MENVIFSRLLYNSIVVLTLWQRMSYECIFYVVSAVFYFVLLSEAVSELDFLSDRGSLYSYYFEFGSLDLQLLLFFNNCTNIWLQ